MRERISGVWGWVIILIVVIIWDGISVISKGRVQTMSEAYFEALQSPHRKWPTILFWLYLSAHLYKRPKWFADKYDPLRRLDLVAQAFRSSR